MVAGFVRRTRERPDLKAWAQIDGPAALHTAAGQDAAEDRRPLSGVPFGIKDVIAADGFETGLGAAAYDGERPGPDSHVAAAIRAAGGIILGKTATCAFAGSDPAPTLNPLDRGRTPGGSSAGSAAAVAAGQVPVAIGTQTAGSVLRPASFCGVVGYKPTFGAIPAQGLFPFAESLDTIGLMARHADDLVYVLPHLVAEREAPPTTRRAPVFVRMKTNWPISRATEHHLDKVVRELRRAGAEVLERECPVDLAETVELHGALCLAEGRRVHADSIRRVPAAYGPRLTEYLGTPVSPAAHEAARAAQGEVRKECDAATGEDEIWLLPTVDGAAPDRTTTGDSSLQCLATFAGLPAASVPSHPCTGRLPFGTQLVARGGNDARLLAAAAWVQSTLPTRLED